jgi:hypothetical protein
LMSLPLAAGFWRISPNVASIRACPYPGACIGGANFTDSGDGYCASSYQVIAFS